MMRILLFILIPFLLFAQNDWSSTAINYPNSFDDTTSIAQIDSNDFVPGSFYNKVMRIGRMLQEKVGVGVDTPKTAKEVLIVVAEDSTIWRLLLPSDVDQEGATSGQVLKWNGSIWAAAADISGAGGSDYADSVSHDGRKVIGDSLITDDEGDARFQPLESTLTDIADGTIVENLVNTANPWADNEVIDGLTASNYVLLTAVADSVEDNAYYQGGTDVADADVADDITLTNLSQVSDAEEAVEDYSGGMFTGNTETGIAVTYQDGDGTVDFVVSVVDSSFFRMETDTLASKNGGTTVLEDTLLISAMSADSLQLNGEWIIKMEKIGTHFAIILTGADTMWAASDTTGF